MPRYNTDALVSTEWLADHLRSPDVRIVDATYYLPHEGKNGREEFERAHIPGAVFFDIDDIADTGSELPHMVPSAEKFSSKVRKLGLGDGSRIVVYDQKGIASSPRAWWMFRLFGHQDVTVLDGGLPKWLAENRPTEEGPVQVRDERHFTARFNHTMLRDVDQMRRNLSSGRDQVLDARSPSRFEGSEELWPGRRLGHIPGSLNLPFNALIDPDTQTLKAPEELERLFDEAGVQPRKPVVTTCGSGLTAAILALGLHVTGHRDVAVYDGSWAEWGLPGDTPVETGSPGRSSD
ncbi:3-mercaptopyruvate sulfurtransferase [Ferruginivarius sediminum]|uniref:Sulfurtransferase n=1 Tax=Ferruginivarius sediminum TaxID=2661937 RepID=A0A369TGZ5_9PROT|nr:3-mercaptopyruvate sulfurtransferase [Ferruginivarius sediminum]RDD63894.1 3-mercaptopyruvate sulfurtransferase [Ferruginivarius sediminum]